MNVPGKLAIIHPMRCGGTWLREQLAHGTGVPLLCSWHRGLDRDWLRGELFDQLRSECGIVHNHLVNWDVESVQFAHERGWQTVMVVREPVEQCASIYRFLRSHFGCTGVTLDEFIFAQALGDRAHYTWIDHRHWAVPPWWRIVDHVLVYQPRLFDAVVARFGPMGRELAAQNGSLADRQPPSHAAAAALRASSFSRRYLDVVAAVGCPAVDGAAPIVRHQTVWPTS